MINIQYLLDDAKCFEVIRELRWPEGTRCPECEASTINQRGFHNTQAQRQRYKCRRCGKQFDDLSDTLFEGHHPPLKTWVLCLYLMGLNLSNRQIAAELDLSVSVVQELTSLLRKKVSPVDRCC